MPEAENMSFIMRVQVIVVATVLVVSAGVVSAQCPDCGDQSVICAAGSPWYRANGAELRISTPGSSDYAQWKYAMPDADTLSIDFETKSQGSSQTGKILLVGGRAMLTKGFSPSKGYEIDALDIPVLNYQLAVTLLSQAFPSGPDKFDGKRAIQLFEQKRGIKIATISASGCYPPPWRLNGEMHRRDSEAIEFSFAFLCKGEGVQQEMQLNGEWKKAMKSPQLDASMSLEGWSLYTLGGISIKQEGATILDYAAQAYPTRLKTLGELQESIRKQNANPKDHR